MQSGLNVQAMLIRVHTQLLQAGSIIVTREASHQTFVLVTDGPPQPKQNILCFQFLCLVGKFLAVYA